MTIKGKTKHGVLNPALYDRLRAEGYSPVKAKKLSNASVQSGSDNRKSGFKSEKNVGHSPRESRDSGGEEGGD